MVRWRPLAVACLLVWCARHVQHGLVFSTRLSSSTSRGAAGLSKAGRRQPPQVARRYLTESASPAIIAEESSASSFADRLLVLQERLKRYDEPIVCRDSVRVAKELRVKLLDVKGQPLVYFGENPDLSALMAACADAPFGQGLATHMDKSVQEALQLGTDRFKLQGVGPKAMRRIMAAAERALLGEARGLLTAEPYALNVYGEGALFAPHEDTYRPSASGKPARQMVGTLLLELPSQYSGGELLLMHRGSGKEVPALLPRADCDPAIMQWCAFFGNVTQEVRMVTSGTKVTAAYALWRKLPEEAEPSPAVSELATHLRSEAARQNGDPRQLSWSCHHTYAADEFPDPEAPDVRKLKGLDAVLGQAAAAAGLGVRLQEWLVVRKEPQTDVQQANEEVMLQGAVSKIDLDVLSGYQPHDEHREDAKLQSLLLDPDTGAADISIGMPANEHLQVPNVGHEAGASETQFYRCWKLIVDLSPAVADE